MKRLWGILAVGVLALSACSSTEAEPTEKVPAETTESTKPAAALESACTDALGDSESADLPGVRLLSDGSLMFVTYMLDGELPTAGTVLYSVTASSKDGNTAYQMGSKFQDGQEVANFVYDMGSATQKNITNGVTAVDGEVASRYALGDLEGLGDDFEWSASVTVDGTDVDRCPDGDGKTQFPNS